MINISPLLNTTLGVNSRVLFVLSIAMAPFRSGVIGWVPFHSVVSAWGPSQLGFVEGQIIVDIHENRISSISP